MASAARIATVCQGGRGHRSVEGNREYMLALARKAAKQCPDLICLPETFTTVGIQGMPPEEAAEPVPGATTDAFADIACDNGCYVICPFRTQREGMQRNSAVILDRNGEICGVYDKVHPVTTSWDYTVMEHGVRPGGDLPVFDLDFGRIGIQICFDAGFPETWAELAAKGVHVVFWPSAYHGGFTLQAYARLYNYYVVTAVRSDESRIIDPCGRVVATTDPLLDVAVRNISLDFMVCHYDFNWAIPDRILSTYPGRVRVTSYRNDGHFIVESLDPALTTEQLRVEFGLETTAQYHFRHRTAYREMAAGTVPTAQMPLHGDRPSYSK